ncbi:MAG: MAPEG family protein [Burkholderiales bacterium]|jgi:uncharacterized MAPEG superfamily protein|nr:hypothetical protein [Betaproteobacteria bacterium]
MTVALWCILVAGLLPITAAAAAKWGFKHYDNANPRAWLAQQTGFRARGNAAQQNSFEGLPLFIGAVMVASFTQGPQPIIDQLAVVYVISRVAYIICYVADRPRLRSLVWTVGIGCNIALFVVASRAPG